MKEEINNQPPFSPEFGNLNGVLFLCPEKNRNTEQLLHSWTKKLPGSAYFETFSRWPDIRIISDAPHILVLPYDPESSLMLDPAGKNFFDQENLGFILLYRTPQDLPADLVRRVNVEIIPAMQQSTLLEIKLDRMAAFLKSRYRSVVMHKAAELSPSGVVICDNSREDNPIVYANKAFSEMTGYSPSEVLGKNCRFLQGKERSQPALEEIGQALLENRPCQVRLKNFRKDGELFWNNLRLSPLSQMEREASLYLGIQQDVTDEVESKKRLRDSEARFRILADTLPQLIWLTNREGEWIFANQRAMLFFKMGSLKETSGIYESKLLHTDRPSDYAKWIEQKTPFEFTAKLNCEGELFAFRLTGTPRYDVGSNFLGFVVSAAENSPEQSMAPHYHDRHRLLASLCMSQMKILRGSTLPSFFAEITALFENLQIGKSFILSSPTGSKKIITSGSKAEKESLLAGQVRSITSTLESPLLIHEGEDGWTGEMDVLAKSIFGPGGNLFYFWKDKNSGWGLFAIKRDPSQDFWSRLDLEMVSSYCQLISLAIERPGTAEMNGFTIDKLLKQLPYPAALLDRQFKELDGNSEWKTFINKHAPMTLQDMLYGGKNPAEDMDAVSGPRMYTCQLGPDSVVRFMLLCIEAGKRYLVWAEDITREHNLEDDLVKFRHFEAVSRIRGELHNEWANLFGTAKLAMESLEGRDLSPMNMEFLSQIRDSLWGMESLSRYTEIYTGETSLNLQETDLNQWLSGQREFLRKIWGEEIQLEFLLKHGDYRVKIDEICMGQVLNSLLSHLYPVVAQEGGAFYFMTCKSADDHNLTLTIATQDPSEASSNGVHKYRPLPEHLHMIEDIIDKHGGKIMVGGSSAKTVSSAIITLPLSARPSRLKEQGKPKRLNPAGRHSILIIDDNIAMTDLIKKYLETKDYRVRVAHDCEEGLAMLTRDPDSYQLCICDILLPGNMKGTQLGHHFRKINPGIQFIFISGYDRTFLMKKFGLLETDILLKKPFSFGDLLHSCMEFKSSIHAE